jgi:2-(1,2-epoxy-1,2-dihydrophenyl)acetyl-CoA isomerase
MQDKSVILSRDGAVLALRLNRPDALNAIDAGMAKSLLAACQDIANDRSVRALLISGAGKAFMAGGDLNAMQANPQCIGKEIIDPLHQALLLLANQDAPVIASVHARVAGAGVSLMLNADFVIAAEDTRFNLAYVAIGTSCDCGASFLLPRVVGLRHALEIALLGQSLDAQEAKRLSLINSVVPAAALQKESMALAQKIANGPTLAMGKIRRLLRQSFETDYESQLNAEKKAFEECVQSADFKEGVAAFLEKRPARYQGFN